MILHLESCFVLVFFFSLKLSTLEICIITLHLLTGSKLKENKK